MFSMVHKMCSSDSRHSSQFSGGRTELLDYEPEICQNCCLIHDGLSKVMDLVGHCDCIVEKTYNKTADHSREY